jgi:hypothetical protein
MQQIIINAFKANYLPDFFVRLRDRTDPSTINLKIEKKLFL